MGVCGAWSPGGALLALLSGESVRWRTRPAPRHSKCPRFEGRPARISQRPAVSIRRALLVGGSHYSRSSFLQGMLFPCTQLRHLLPLRNSRCYQHPPLTRRRSPQICSKESLLVVRNEAMSSAKASDQKGPAVHLPCTNQLAPSTSTVPRGTVTSSNLPLQVNDLILLELVMQK